MTNALRFGWNMLWAPSKALKRLKDSDAALSESSAIFFVFIVASIAFFTWKPENFPPINPDSPIPMLRGGSHNVLFWTQVQLWQPVLALLATFSLSAFVALFRAQFGSLKVQVGLAFIAAVIPGLSLMYYISNRAAPVWILAGVWLLITTCFFPVLRRRTFAEWKRLFSTMMAMNVIAVALNIPMSVMVFLKWPAGYTGIYLLMFLWMLGLGTYLIRDMEQLTTPRALMAFFFALLWENFLTFSLFFLDILPRQILKALMTI